MIKKYYQYNLIFLLIAYQIGKQVVLYQDKKKR